MKVSPISPRNQLLMGALVLILALGFCRSPWGEAWETFCYDMLFALRGPQRPPEEIVVVAIDEASFGVIDRQWPWPRELHAKLIDTLYAAGAKTVALDLLFPETSVPEEDRLLADAVSRHPSLIMAADINRIEDSAYASETVVGPNPLLVTPQTRIGAINLPVERDAFIRQISKEEPPLEALAPVAARYFLDETAPFEQIQGNRIHFYGPPRTLKTISYYQALEPAAHLPSGFFKDKLVFIGFSTQNISDLKSTHPDHFPTPYTRWGGGYMAGVEIHATIAANILEGNLITSVSAPWTTGICILLWTGTGILFFRFRPLTGGLFLGLSWIALLSVTLFLFNRSATHLPLVQIGFPMTAVYFTGPFVHYAQSRREKNYIRKAFATYVSPSVVRQLIEFPERLKLGGEDREITAFFSDVQGFSGISERLSPSALVELLNEFLTEMTDIILNHDGTVDKFEGDAIIAMFGAPNILETHADAACRAAVEMQKRLAELRGDWQKRGLPELKMRIGLCSGRAVVGNMGSKQRMDYTMMGDTVNTAARLEGANKCYGTFTMLAESTRLPAKPDIAFRELDKIKLVGKKESITAFELLGYATELDPRFIDTLDAYAQGLGAYRNRSWAEAAGHFRKALDITPEDPPSQVMLARCESYKIHPPDEPWNGAFTMETK